MEGWVKKQLGIEKNKNKAGMEYKIDQNQDN